MGSFSATVQLPLPPSFTLRTWDFSDGREPGVTSFGLQKGAREKLSVIFFSSAYFSSGAQSPYIDGSSGDRYPS